MAPDPAGEYVRGTVTERVPSSVRLNFFIGFQILLTVTVLAVAIGLIATLPEGASSPTPISFEVFVTIFSILGWVHILFVSKHIEEKLAKSISMAVVALSLIFYLASALALTVAIAPAQSCSDSDYTSKNKLLAGVGGSRCQLIQANIALLWIGNTDIRRSDLAFATYFLAVVLKMKRYWKKVDDAIYNDDSLE
jgi:Membrane-associating domain